MNQLSLYTKISALPAEMKAEVAEFIDFLLSKKTKQAKKKKPIFGSAKGKLKISDDFDEPLDDFKDYMK
jgi:hypothetical protein